MIAAIDQLVQAKVSSTRHNQERLTKAKAKALAAGYQTKWESALAREIRLLREMVALKKTLAKLIGDRVVPIRGESRRNLQSK